MTTAAYTLNTVFPNNCYILTAKNTISTVPTPWLIQNTANRTLSFSSSSPSEIEVYTVDLVAKYFEQTTCSEIST